MDRVYQLLNKLAVILILLLSPAGPVAAFPSLHHEDMCGVSLSTSDYAGQGSFTSIEGTWTLPQVFLRSGEVPPRFVGMAQEVVLCCGDDCSTRLSAGILSTMGANGTRSNSDLVLQFSPFHEPLAIALPIGIGAYCIVLLPSRPAKR